MRAQLVAIRDQVDAVLVAIGQAVVATPPAAPAAPAAPVRAAAMSADDYAAHARVSRDTVYRWITAGLPVRRLAGRLVRIDADAADAWLHAGGPNGARERAGQRAARRAR